MGNNPSLVQAEIEAAQAAAAKAEKEEEELRNSLPKADLSRWVYKVQPDPNWLPKLRENSETLREYVTFIINPDELGDIPPKSEAFNVLEWLFFDEDPKKAQEDFSNVKSRVCGSVWGKGTMAYRCRTCQTNDSSCICLKCFEKGKHKEEGHDYKLYNSPYGGCCDCGDPQAWKPSGNCSNHGPEHAEEEKKPLPPHIYLSSHYVSKIIFEVLLDDLTKYPDRPAIFEKNITALLLWLRQKCSMTDKFREVMAQEVLKMDKDKNNAIPLIHRLLDVSFSLRSTSDIAVNFLMDLLFNPEFKKEFCKHLLATYPRFTTDEFAAKPEPEKEHIMNSLTTLAPQLFHIETMVSMMCREMEMMQTMLRAIHKMVSVPDAQLEQQTIVLHRFLGDVSQILKYKSVTSYLLDIEHDKRPFDAYLDIMQALQGGWVIKRKVGDHVEFEENLWLSIWQINYSIVTLNRAVIDLLTDRESLQQNQEREIQHVKGVIDVALQRLMDWTRTQNFGTEDQSGITNFSVFEQPITVHIPLHRLVAGFVWEVAKLNLPNIELSDLLKLNEKEALLMLENPVDIQVMMSQINAGFWRRNGEKLTQQLRRLYKHIYCSVGIEPDVFLLQLGLVQLGPEKFTRFLLKRFEVEKWFYGDQESTTFPDGTSVLAEDFLALLVIVGTNRLLAGQTDILRGHLLHSLSWKDLTMSQLMERLPERWRYGQDSIVEDKLNEIADFYRPPMDQGRYKLKTETWKDVDPYFLYHTQFENQSMYEQYQLHRKAVKGPRAKPSIVPAPLPTPLWHLVRNINSIFHCGTSSELIFIVLYNAAQSDSRATDSLIDTAIHFISIALRVSPPTQTDAEDPQTSIPSISSFSELEALYARKSFFDAFKFEVKYKGAEPVSIIALLVKVLEREDMKERAEIISGLLQQVTEKDPSLHQKFAVHIPRESEQDRKKREADERKAAILAQFKKEQGAFSSMIDDEEEEEEEEGAKLTCVLCREPAAPDRPIGAIAHVQRSRIHALTHRRNAYRPGNAPVEIGKQIRVYPLEKEKIAENLKAMLEDKRITPEVYHLRMAELLPDYKPEATDAEASEKASAQNAENSSALEKTESEKQSESKQSVGQQAEKQEQPTNIIVTDAKPTPEQQQLAALLALSLNEVSAFFEASRALTEMGQPPIDPLGNLRLSYSTVEARLEITPQDDEEIEKIGMQQLSEHLIARVQRFLNAQVSACSHYIHHDCLEHHRESKFSNANSISFEETLLDAKDNEFLCPACRRVASILLPTELEGPDVPPATILLPETPADTLSWVSQTGSLTSTAPYSLGASDRKFLEIMVQTIYDAQKKRLLRGKANQFTLIYMCNVITSNYSEAEISQRDSPTPMIVNKSMKIVFNCLSSSLKRYMAIGEEHRAKLLSSLVNTIKPSTSTLDVLGGDMFDILVRWTYLSEDQSKSNVLLKIKLLYRGVIIQALLTYAATQLLTEPQSNSLPSLNLSQVNSLSKLYEYLLPQLAVCKLYAPASFSLETITAAVKEMSLPFLRRSYLLLSSILSTTFLPANTFDEEFDHLLTQLELSTKFDDLFSGEEYTAVIPMIESWVARRLNNGFDQTKLLDSPLELHPRPFALIDLPELFQDIFHQYISPPMSCKECNKVPEDPALCLVCGAFLCFNAPCCQLDNGAIGEVWMHSITCGGGEGIFLLLKHSVVLLVHERQSAFWGSPYLDAHGEEDLFLRRGRPLLRNPEIYKSLASFLSSHVLDREILRRDIPPVKTAKLLLATVKF